MQDQSDDEARWAWFEHRIARRHPLSARQRFGRYALAWIGILAVAFLIAMGAEWAARYCGFPGWVGSIVSALLGVALYVISGLLVPHYIVRRAPRAFHTAEAWEATAGTGVVPKWVSLLGLLAVAAALASVIPIVACALRWAT
jgi:hypothetical protein